MVDSVIITTRPRHEDAYQTLIAAGINPLLARLWSNRGVSDVKDTCYEWKNLLPPSLLTHSTQAAQLLADAIAQKKRIVVVADYDCDGATACALALRGLRLFGALVDFVVPNRFETGYGLSPQVVDVVLKRIFPQPDLILTVDNGIASIEGVRYAKEKGMDVIVTDHHLPADQTPDALCIVNPNQRGCTFPSKNLAGVGVMYYLLIALRRELINRGHYPDGNYPRLEVLSDLVALGTVADVVKLDTNNRILVTKGLERMRKNQANVGIQALFQVAGCNIQKANSMDLGFRVGPRINAAGRLQDMSIGIHCLSTDDPDEALELAKQLDFINRERQQIQETMSDQALADLERNAQDQQLAGLSVYNPSWHQGVVGIVASRLKELFFKPVFAFAPADNGDIRGSGRSVPDVHLRDALDLVSKRHPNLIAQFGGHAMAAGLTIKEKDLPLFAQALHDAIVEMTGKTSFKPVIETDGSLPNEWATFDNAQLLQDNIWGAGFPPPSFYDTFIVKSQSVLKEKHLKLWLEKDGIRYNAIWFGHNQLVPDIVNVVYELVTNEWNGNKNVQLLVRHVGDV